MARSTRSFNLENKTRRLQLKVQRKPYSIKIARGVRLAYRRNLGPGTWSVLAADGEGGTWLRKIGHSDDFESSDGKTVLDYWQAVEAAKKLARADADDEPGERPATVAEAIEAYRLDLVTRGGREANATGLLPKLSAPLAASPVGMVTTRDIVGFRDRLLRTVKRVTVSRYLTSLLAALRLAAKMDKRITNAKDWKIEALPSDSEPRNVILSDAEVRAVMAEANRFDASFGLLVEVLAISGTRISQARRLTVGDLAGDRLMVPASKKGKGGNRRAAQRTPVPITTDLSVRLHAAVAGRPAEAPLLRDSDGEPWQVGCQTLRFCEVAKAAGLDPSVVTINALRHSSIVRMLLANTPIRLVASLHNTSVEMIERTYSKHISHVGDALARGSLQGLTAPAGDNIIPIPITR